MTFTIRRAVVIGSGTMGGGIAAHFANAGIPVYLLDISQKIVAASLERLKKNKPPAFFTPETADLVTIGNLDDHEAWISEGDWIVEAIIEELPPKRALVARIDRLRKPESIVSSNTSGLPIAMIAADASAGFKSHFLGTHFFNPPRYMKLLEIIPTKETKPEITEFVRDFAEKRLGKGVVICKDTPNFIANRMASVQGATLLDFVLKNGYTIEEVDAIAGPLIGRPKTAAFRLQDLVGLDVASSVASNLYGLIADDESREILRSPRVEALRKDQMDRGRLGDKSGQGFYKKGGKAIETLDLETREYRPRREPEIPSIAEGMKIKSLPDRLHFVLKQDDKAGALARHIVYNSLAYAARRIPEITDDIANVDRAMRWGFSHEMGPFELWDALGVRATAEAMKKNGVAVPEWVTKKDRFYTNESREISTDLGDGVLYSLFPAIDVEEFERGPWVAMVIECADAMENVSPDTLRAIRFCSKPIVTAVSGRTIGGGAEVVMASARIVAAAETYMGSGGVKELVRRVISPAMRKNPNGDPLSFVQNALQIAMGRVTSSASEAQQLGLVDHIVMNRDHLVAAAKEDALALEYSAPSGEKNCYAAGRDVAAALHAGIYNLQQGAYMSEEQAAQARKLASALCGGELSSGQWVDEEFFDPIESPRPAQRGEGGAARSAVPGEGPPHPPSAPSPPRGGGEGTRTTP